MVLAMVIEILLGLIYFGSSAAFNAFGGVGVICLTAAYATPIAISLITGRKQVKKGSFYLGKLGFFCNCVAIGMYNPIIASSANWISMVFVGSSFVLHAFSYSCR